MTRSYDEGRIAYSLFKERYRSPTLELVIPAVFAGFAMIPAFLADSKFTLFGLAVASIPLVSVPETIALSLMLRNIVYVMGDHMNTGSFVSYLLMPIGRGRLFLWLLVSDVLVPLVIWLLSGLVYYLGSGYLGFFLILASVFTAGFLVTSSVILLLTLVLRSPGSVTLVSLFSLGSVFGVGGLAPIALGEGSYYLTAPLNPFTLLLLYEKGVSHTFLALVEGVLVDLMASLLIFAVSYMRFRVLEP